MDADYVIIGGGVVGLSLAWGLLRQKRRVIVLDGSDGDFRASRGNFGLVWVQSKGINAPHYAAWSQRSAAAWPEFARELAQESGQSVPLEQKGGWDFYFDEEKLDQRLRDYEALKAKLHGNYPYQVVRGSALKKEEPHIGDKVIAGILHDQDGHTNPLRLLRALAFAVSQKGGKILTGKKVHSVSDGYLSHCEDGSRYGSGKVILAAGLGAMELAPSLGFKDIIRPQHGQVLITEKIPKLIHRPSLIARQVDEGGIQIGASNDEVGLHDEVAVETLSKLARIAVDTYPNLAKTKLIRSWASLRILSPDGLPIYQQSSKQPGVFWVTCHSGITLAAVHALAMPSWFEQPNNGLGLEKFSENRF